MRVRECVCVHACACVSCSLRVHVGHVSSAPDCTDPIEVEEVKHGLRHVVVGTEQAHERVVDFLVGEHGVDGRERDVGQTPVGDQLACVQCC